MLPTNREEFREVFRFTFQKMTENRPMSPLESQIAEVIAEHPEYHAILSGTASTQKDYLPETGETNPFLHLALHVSVRDQLRLNRPAGSLPLFQELCRLTQDPHHAEHLFLDVLAECLHEAARTGVPPDEHAYLERLRKIFT